MFGFIVPSMPPQEVECLSSSIATSLSIRWSPPPNDALNGVLQGYRLLLTRISHDTGMKLLSFFLN